MLHKEFRRATKYQHYSRTIPQNAEGDEQHGPSMGSAENEMARALMYN